MKKIRRELIYPNPDQPRKHFDQAALEGLAQSIKENELVEPIIVTKRGKKYMIIAGERRWRACGIAGIESIPVIIKAADDKTVAELSLLENLQREDLNILEEAWAFKGLVDMGMTHEEIARKMGMKQIWRIQERLNILKLMPVFQEYTLKSIITPSQAQELSRLPKDEQGIVFDKISSGKLNSYEKLRSFVNAMLFVKEQESFLPDPSPVGRAVNTKYDRMIESIEHFIDRSFNRDDLTVLSAVLSPAARANIDRIDMIILHLNKIKKALLQSASNREAMEQSTMTLQ
jgi:ParB family transcriptional regulator, chromosome partitioning protein